MNKLSQISNSQITFSLMMGISEIAIAFICVSLWLQGGDPFVGLLAILSPIASFFNISFAVRGLKR